MEKGEITQNEQFHLFPQCNIPVVVCGFFDWLIEWCFTPLSVFQSYHRDNSHYSCLSWVSPVLGWCSEVFCPRTLPGKKPEDPVRLKPTTPGLRVEHFTIEPRRTPVASLNTGLSQNGILGNGLMYTYSEHIYVNSYSIKYLDLLIYIFIITSTSLGVRMLKFFNVSFK